jgi:hypothetical protein
MIVQMRRNVALSQLIAIGKSLQGCPLPLASAGVGRKTGFVCDYDESLLYFVDCDPIFILIICAQGITCRLCMHLCTLDEIAER